MEMRASQVIKGAMGGGAKKMQEETDRGRRRHKEDTFKSKPERCGNWDVTVSYSSTEACVTHCSCNFCRHKGHCYFRNVRRGVITEKVTQIPSCTLPHPKKKKILTDANFNTFSQQHFNVCCLKKRSLLTTVSSMCQMKHVSCNPRCKKTMGR